MRRVLIVSPNFPPKSTADIHRVRASLRHYREFGWEATVLCVDPAYCEGLDDPELAASLPEQLDILRVKVWRQAVCRRFGFGQLAYRSLMPLYRAGCRLLARESYDVVLFSTTAFLSFTLGPLWKRRYGCGVVYDFHDPWYDEDPPYTRDTAPGGWRKYRLDRFIAKHAERFAMRAADHVVTVSAGIAAGLRTRHRDIAAGFTVLPFPAAADDYALACRHGAPPLLDTSAGAQHWVYAGAYTTAMQPVVEALFAALAERPADDQPDLSRLRVHFVGTNYAPAERARPCVAPLAAAYGLGDLVTETPQRIPYFDALALYAASDAILLIGSVDADYTASKLLTCVAAKKPTLALFHRRSLAAELAPRFPNVFLAAFDENPAEPGFRARLDDGLAWLRSAPCIDADAVDAALAPWSARKLTRRQCAIFDQVAARSPLPASQAQPHPGTAR